MRLKKNIRSPAYGIKVGRASALRDEGCLFRAAENAKDDFMHYVYILISKFKNRTYIGCTKNLSRRLSEHNNGKVRSTKAFMPWEIAYFEEIENREEAFRREKEIKSYKGNIKFRNLLRLNN